METKQETLEAIKLAAMIFIPDGIFDIDLKLETTQPIIDNTGKLIYNGLEQYLRCDCKVLGKIENYEVQIPDTWWDHFKIDVMPKWFNDRFPPKYKTNEVIIRWLYPEFKPSEEDQVIKISNI